MIEFTQKLESFDEVKVGNLIKIVPDALASCFVLAIDSYDTKANVSWMLSFHNEKPKKDFGSNIVIFNKILFLNSTFDPDSYDEKYYWTKL